MALIVDDAQLLRMVAEPPRDAVPALSRAVAFAPIVWLLAVVPPVVVLTRAVLDAETAAWAVRSLSVVQADRLQEWLIPGTGFGTEALSWMPPLQTWLTAMCLRWAWPGAVSPTIAVSAVASGLTLLLIYSWLREALGERIAVLGAVMWGLHPQFLQLAGSGRPDGLTVALLTCIGWGLWGHWRGPPTFVSMRLLCAGLAWGLALLAGGPVAIAAWAAILLLWLWEGGRSLSGNSAAEEPSTLQLGRGAVLVLITGGALSLWWIAMVLADSGAAFLDGWLRLAPPRYQMPTPLPLSGKRFLQDVQPWLSRSAFLAGWWLVGLRHALRPRSEDGDVAAQALGRWMVCWTVVGVTLRLIPTLIPSIWPAATRPWEAFLFIPTVILSAQGLDAVIRREVSNRVFVGALTVTVAAVVWAVTGRLTIGLIVAGFFAGLIFASAPIAIGLRRASLAWTEAGIRNWIQVAALVTLLGPLVFHAIWLSQPQTARARYATLRSKLLLVPAVNRISLITDAHDTPQELEYLLRSLWPRVPFTRAAGWDPKLTETIVEEADAPVSRMLIVEWSRKELRLRSDVGNVWQITPVMEPMAYGQRRLAVQVIAPADPTGAAAL
ncbi:MAG: glycosyltransferase family 39 protein [Planctomycetaceae bacterium]|nr:glycosyltransferase family 39 protein [Planctomycetaceae bacterium]